MQALFYKCLFFLSIIYSHELYYTNIPVEPLYAAPRPLCTRVGTLYVAPRLHNTVPYEESQSFLKLQFEKLSSKNVQTLIDKVSTDLFE